MKNTIRACVWLSLLATAIASSFVMMSDEALVEQADWIVAGSVLDGAAIDDGAATEYRLAPSRILKGGDLPQTIRIRVPGGDGSGGGRRILGAPRFEAGDDVLLFLSPGRAGAYNILQFHLGAFRLMKDRGLWVRDLDSSAEIRLPEQPDRSQYRLPRKENAFLDWIAAASTGNAGQPDYFAAEDSAAKTASPRFTLIRSDLPIRWFSFEQGGVVHWNIHQGGQPGLPSEGSSPAGTAAFKSAIQAWNDDPDTPIAYQFDGTTQATGGLQNQDGVNTLLFGDPNNEMAGKFACGTGGILAIGGPFFSQTVMTFKGRDFHPAIFGDIVMNDGIECLLTGVSDADLLVSEIYAHELGHTLGLGHSCGDSKSGPCIDPVANEAVMRAFSHLDFRGPMLAADDRSGIRFLYGDSQVGPAQQQIVFPQAADGAAGSIRFQTSLLLTNTGSTDEVLIEFFQTLPDDPAAPMEVTIAGLGTGSAFQRALLSGETALLETTGTGPLRAGYVRLTSLPSVGSIVIFTRSDGGVTVTEAGVPAASPAQDFSFTFDQRGFRNTGVSLVYPPDDDAQSAEVTARLYDASLNELATATFQMLPGEKRAQFVGEIFDQAVEGIGSVTIESTQSLAAVVLRQTDDPSVGLPGDVPILTAFPVYSGRADASSSTLSGTFQFLAEDRIAVEVDVRPGDFAVYGAVYKVFSQGRLIQRFVRDASSGGRFTDVFRIAAPMAKDSLRITAEPISESGLGRPVFLSPRSQ